VNGHRLERLSIEMTQAQLFFAIANLIVSLFTTLMAIAAGFFAYIQWRKANATKRAEFIIQILGKLRDDRDMGETFERVVNTSEWLDRNYRDNKEEFEIDRLFAYLSFVCLLYRTDLIHENELILIRYKLNTVCKNTNVQTYLWNQFHYWKAPQRNTVCSFQELIDYGIEKKLIDPNSFNDKTSKQYRRILTF